MGIDLEHSNGRPPCRGLQMLGASVLLGENAIAESLTADALLTMSRYGRTSADATIFSGFFGENPRNTWTPQVRDAREVRSGITA